MANPPAADDFLNALGRHPQFQPEGGGAETARLQFLLQDQTGVDPVERHSLHNVAPFDLTLCCRNEPRQGQRAAVEREGMIAAGAGAEGGDEGVGE